MPGTSPSSVVVGSVNLDLVAMAPRLPAPGETVTEIALRHGVWELGRFAHRYKFLFGELPSETLT